ncbi:glycosyltransferase family 4 protein [Paenibacillus gorillae]|uniref:glycosyltransferase family 4 protein n=1 Tax=Paenibacillus gorillae TaxID=1243662 RepID=UPI0004BBE6AE|nr:glycosyltransferase family 4 protein [Paenibacillus gorillae]
MRIALVSYWCVPYTGGVSTYVLALRQGLEARGHEVDIISHDSTGLNYHIIDKGKSMDKMTLLNPIMQQIHSKYNEKSLHYDPWLAQMKGEHLAFKQALSVFSLAGYDLIHAQDVISAASAYEVKSHGTPLIVTLHGKLAAEWQLQKVVTAQSPAWHWANELDHYGSTVGDRYIVPSKWLKQQYKEAVRSRKPAFEIIPYGFDTLSFLRQSASLPPVTQKNGGKLILCPARLDAVKGHQVLLQALALLKKSRTDWVCWLAGDGPLRAELEQLRDQLQLQHHVQFLGHRNDMAALLKEADIVVLPSIHDNLPFVIMEAQIAGKAIIASDTGGIPEMITDGKTGLLFPPARAEKLCLRINKLCNEDSLRKRLANDARYYGLRQWPLYRMIERTVDLYEKALQAKPGNGG